jgi:hypothetical protein
MRPGKFQKGHQREKLNSRGIKNAQEKQLFWISRPPPKLILENRDSHNWIRKYRAPIQPKQIYSAGMEVQISLLQLNVHNRHNKNKISNRISTKREKIQSQTLTWGRRPPTLKRFSLILRVGLNNIEIWRFRYWNLTATADILQREHHPD